jgi:hypothetical protein
MGGASAQALQHHEAPPELRGWVPWVLDTMGDEVCPMVGEQPVCVWPGLLQLDLKQALGQFRHTVIVDRRTLVDLPGSSKAWPQDVQVNGNAAVVLDREGTPALLLGVGAHTIEGTYLWRELPETLRVPSQMALISLRRDGELIDFPKRDPELLWLRATSVSSEEPQRLTLEVFRALQDNVPFKVTTRLVLRVAGKAREVNLGNVLLPESNALAIESALPVRLNEDQTLSAQVYAGTHSIDIEALFATPPGDLAQREPVEHWPTTEFWVLEPNPALRQVELQGAPAVDPSRTSLPENWKNLATYAVPNDADVALVTSRRGEPDSPPNRLNLSRDIWFDLNGGAYTIRDTFSGRLNRDWRLDLTEGALGRVLVDGEPQLITQNPKTDEPGVELRKGQLSMVAEWRTEGSVRHFPAVGWTEDVQHLDATVHVPPGWQLIGATGVDGLSETWWSSWDLFSVFFVLIVSIAIGQLMHPSWGMLALITMVLTHDQPDAPRVLWASVVVVIAILRVVPAGRFRKVVATVGFGLGCTLLVVLVDYTTSEVRTALFPQTADQRVSSSQIDGMLEQESAMSPPHAPSPSGAGRGAMDDADYGSYGAKLSRKSGVPEPAPKQSAVERVQKQQDPQAVVQTGPGIPTWSWRSWSLSWSGPVSRDHQLRLYLLSPLGSGLISTLRIFLGGMLAFLLLRFGVHQARHAPRRRKRRASAATLVLGMLGALLVTTWTPSAQAEFPSAELLQELRSRITRKPLCHPHCISVQRMDVTIEGNELTVSSEVHASDDDSYQLPGPLESWSPTDVRINGIPAAGMMLAEDGFLHLRLPPGRYRVVVKGPALGNNLTLTLGKKPRWVQVVAEGWEVDGIDETGAVEGSLRFHKQEDTAEADRPTAQVSLPSWLLITRTLKFGANWTISTLVERLGSAGSPMVERFMLLPGEQVTRADLVVEGGQVVLSLARNETTLAFDSVLEPTEMVTLVATEGQRVSERWIVQCGPIWRCRTEGTAPASHQTDGHWEPRFSPWPSDILDIHITRPVAANGKSLTIDAAAYEVVPGSRLTKATLTAQLRSSSRNTLSVEVPRDAEVQELLLDGERQALQQADGKLEVAVDPGDHSLALSWQQPGGMGFHFQTPQVKLGSQAANLRVNLTVPEDRWLLFAQGPRWGPAVLFWGYLAFIALVGLVLGRLPASPLSELQWIVLGIGLTQVPAPVAVLIAGWFFAVAFIPSWRPRTPIRYNLSQISLVVLTIIFVVCLFGAVYDGLLSTPDMQVHGAGSSNRNLSWYVDRSEGTLPDPWTWTTPLWVWRSAMLAWSLWLAFNLLRWLKWSFNMFASNGLWMKLPRRAPSPPPHGNTPTGYPPGFTPSPAPVAYPGAQWVVTGSEPPPAPKQPSGSGPPTPHSAVATHRDGPSGELPRVPPPKPTSRDPSSIGEKGPATLPTGSVMPKAEVAEPDSGDAEPIGGATPTPNSDTAPNSDAALDSGAALDSQPTPGSDSSPSNEPASKNDSPHREPSLEEDEQATPFGPLRDERPTEEDAANDASPSATVSKKPDDSAD